MDRLESLRARVGTELERSRGSAAPPAQEAPRLHPIARLLRVASSTVLLIVLAIVAAMLGYPRVAFVYLIAISLVNGAVSVLRRVGLLGEGFGSRPSWGSIVLKAGLPLALAVAVLNPTYAPVALVVAFLILWRSVHPLVITLQHSLHPDPDDPARL